MKKIISIIFLFIIFPLNILAITSSGVIPSSQKITIEPINGFGTQSSSYGTVATFYENDTTLVSTKVVESSEVYTSELYASKACDLFILSDGNDKTCLDEYNTSLGYKCVINGKTKLETKDGVVYDGIDTDQGILYDSESSCLNACVDITNSDNKGECSLVTGYKYKYQSEEYTTSTEGKYKGLSGDRYKTSSGGDAFCIQPALKMTGGENNYCLDSTFDLSSCNTSSGYKKDYRCGIAYIILHATKLENDDDELSDKEYKIADVASRLYAAYNGLRGTNKISSSDSSITYVYSLTAKRASGNVNYATNGLVCSTEAKNVNIMCHMEDDKDTYFYYESGALKLFRDAVNATKVEVNDSKVPTILTEKIDYSTDKIIISKPCDPSEDGCVISIKLIGPDGNEIDKDDNVTCSKDYCTAQISGEKITTCDPEKSYYIKISIENFDMGGSVKEYRYCSDPTNNQIMFVIDANAESRVDTWSKEYKIDVSCSDTSCTSNTLKTTVTSVNQDGTKNISTSSCDGYDTLNSGNYDGVDTITISEPSLDDILDSCDKSYFEQTKYETNTGGYCKIYCRKETVINLPDKTKVFSGMQFKYELENKIPTTKTTDANLTSVVNVKTECVSDINYDTWKSDYESALSAVADAWSEWNGYKTLFNEQNNSSSYPTAIAIDPSCSATCEGLGNSSTSSVCGGDVGDVFVAASGKKVSELCAGKSTTNVNSGGICNPGCTYRLMWPERTYNAYKYSGGSFSSSTKAISANSGSVGVSDNSCSYTAHVTLSETYFSNNTRDKSYSLNFNASKENPNYSKSTCENSFRSISCSACKSYTYKSGYCTSSSSTSCTFGENGDINEVYNKMNNARNAYVAAQEKVQQLLNYIQNCSLFGASDWISTDPSIISYAYDSSGNVSSTQSSSIVSSSLENSLPVYDKFDTFEYVGKGTSSTVEIEKDAEYKYLVADSTTEYNVSYLGSDTSTMPIKKLIISGSSCATKGNCPDLVVSYADKVYGEDVEYTKVANILNDENIKNTYCTKNSTGEYVCSSNASSSSVNIIICNEDSCSVSSLSMPNAHRVYFTTTTEIDYYRPLHYYTENYTGNVITLKNNTNVDNSRYSYLGSYLYPIDTVDTGIYEVNYKFTNIGSGKYYNNQNVTNYDYTCAYEAYNEINIPDDYEPGVCVYDEDNVLNLSKTTLVKTNSKSLGFTFKNVDLNDLFNNKITSNVDRMGSNWKENTEVINEIESKGDDILLDESYLELSVTLNSDSIKKIREYNKLRENNAGGYLDDSLNSCEYDETAQMFTNCKSMFIDDFRSNNESNAFGVILNHIKEE